MGPCHLQLVCETAMARLLKRYFLIRTKMHAPNGARAGLSLILHIPASECFVQPKSLRSVRGPIPQRSPAMPRYRITWGAIVACFLFYLTASGAESQAQTTFTADANPCAGKQVGDPCDDGNSCTVSETCQNPQGGGGKICTSGTAAPAGTPCRASAGPCDPAETCNGTSTTCPADARSPTGTSCTSDGNPCTLDQCDGTSVNCQHPAGNGGTTCRASAGECDPAETCNGTSTACPADARSPTGTSCTSDGNPCTLDQCDGSSVSCQHPAGNAGATCRAAAGDCDVAETCNGASDNCPV